MLADKEKDFATLIAKMETLQIRLQHLMKKHPADKTLASPQDFGEGFGIFLDSFYNDEIKNETEDADYFLDGDGEPIVVCFTQQEAELFKRKITFIFEQGFYPLTEISAAHLTAYRFVLKKFTERFLTDLSESQYDVCLIIYLLEKILYCLKISPREDPLKTTHEIFSKIFCLPKHELQVNLTTILNHLSQGFNIFSILEEEKRKFIPSTLSKQENKEIDKRCLDALILFKNIRISKEKKREDKLSANGPLSINREKRRKSSAPSRSSKKNPAIVKSGSKSDQKKSCRIKEKYDYQYIFSFLFNRLRNAINYSMSIYSDLEDSRDIISEAFEDFFALDILSEDVVGKIINPEAVAERALFLKKLPENISIFLKTLRILPIYDPAYESLSRLMLKFKSLNGEQKLSQEQALEKIMANLEETLNFSNDIGKGLNLPPTADTLVSEIVQTASAFNRVLPRFIMLALTTPDFRLPLFSSTAMTVIIKINVLVSTVISMLTLNKEHPPQAEIKRMIKSAVDAYSFNPDELKERYETLSTAVTKYKESISTYTAKTSRLGLLAVSFNKDAPTTPGSSISSTKDEKSKSSSSQTQTPINPRKHTSRARQECIQYLRSGCCFYKDKDYTREKLKNSRPKNSQKTPSLTR